MTATFLRLSAFDEENGLLECTVNVEHISHVSPSIYAETKQIDPDACFLVTKHGQEIEVAMSYDEMVEKLQAVARIYGRVDFVSDDLLNKLV